MTAPAPPAIALPEGFADLADGYEVALCDLWGVVHDGSRAFAEALDALRRFRRAGGRVVLVTNAPRPRGPVLTQLAGLGVTDDAFDALVTSGDVTVAAIVERGAAPVHHIGPERDLALFEAVRRRSGSAPALSALADAHYVVVSGLRNDETETPGDYAAELDAMRGRGLTMVCANPDVTVHVGHGVRYCGGALAEAYAALGGDTVLAGKPHPPIYAAALAEAEAALGRAVDRSKVLAIGDGLRTDVAGAAAQGLDVLFITDGIHRAEFHPEGASDRATYAERLARLTDPVRAAMPRLVWSRTALRV